MRLGARPSSRLPELRRGDFDRVVKQGPVVTTFVLFDGGTVQDRSMAAALAAAQQAHPDRVRAFVVQAADYASYIDETMAARRAFDTYDFSRRPCVALYRGGHLVTTFSPRSVFGDARLQARELRAQLDICISKFCDYDPGSVRDQTNIAEAMKHEVREREAKTGGGAAER